MMRKRDFENHGEADEADRLDPTPDDDLAEESEGNGRSEGTTTSVYLTERLRRILRDEGDADLLPDRGDGGNGVMQWLQALDLQVLGACRADERLKPLFKLNSSTGVAEDNLMAQLSQHFEASEVGMLVRCLFVPLVSIRVGKVNKQGNLLCPTNIRGHLNLTLLPSSDMHILFCGDDGSSERLAVLSRNSESSEVIVEEIPVDTSGRSFLLKLPGNQVSYFWCSEKSTILGVELLEKMRNLLQRRRSLSQLTGICESRLDSFASHLRAYLLGSTNSSESTSATSSESDISVGFSISSRQSDLSSPSTSANLKSARSRLTAGQPGKGHPLYQGSLSPRSNTFKDGLSRSLSSLRNGAREKFKRRGDSNSNLLVTNSLAATASTLSEIGSSSSCNSQLDGDNLPVGEALQDPPISFPDLPCLALPSSSFSPLAFHLPLPQLSSPRSPLFSPYYCWCPPCSSSFQHMATPPDLSSDASESLPLPPLSSLLSAAGSVSFLPSKPPLEQTDLSTFELPALFPVSSYITMPGQQIPTFTPFMSDPIVHIPIIDVCSSGPGYLVSAGPAISSAIPPLLPNLVRPEAESVVEKNARDTLHMLMASTPTSPQLMKVLPAVLTTVSENFPYVNARKSGVVVTGSRGLYSGAQDVDAVSNSISLMDLSSYTGPAAYRESEGRLCQKHGESEASEKHGEEEAMEKPGP